MYFGQNNLGNIRVHDDEGTDRGIVFKYDNGVGQAWGFRLWGPEGTRNEFAYMTKEKPAEALLRVANGGPEYVRILRRRSF